MSLPPSGAVRDGDDVEARMAEIQATLDNTRALTVAVPPADVSWLLAQLREARKDRRRYEFVRNVTLYQVKRSELPYVVAQYLTTDDKYPATSDIDAAVDVAIAASTPQPEAHER